MLNRKGGRTTEWLFTTIIFFASLHATTAYAQGSAEENVHDPCARIAGRGQEEKENPQKAVHLRSDKLLKLARIRKPILPPSMLDGSKLHGKVTLEVYINKSGAVVGVKALKGHPLALPSAVESLREWVFAPYLVHGQPRCVFGVLTLDYDFRPKTDP